MGDGGTRRIVFVSGRDALGLDPIGGMAARGEGTEAKCLKAEVVGPIGADGNMSPVSIIGRGGCNRCDNRHLDTFSLFGSLTHPQCFSKIQCRRQYRTVVATCYAGHVALHSTCALAAISRHIGATVGTLAALWHRIGVVRIVRQRI